MPQCRWFAGGAQVTGLTPGPANALQTGLAHEGCADFSHFGGLKRVGTGQIRASLDQAALRPPAVVVCGPGHAQGGRDAGPNFEAAPAGRRRPAVAEVCLSAVALGHVPDVAVLAVVHTGAVLAGDAVRVLASSLADCPARDLPTAIGEVALRLAAACWGPLAHSGSAGLEGGAGPLAWGSARLSKTAGSPAAGLVRGSSPDSDGSNPGAAAPMPGPSTRPSEAGPHGAKRESEAAAHGSSAEAPGAGNTARRTVAPRSMARHTNCLHTNRR